MRGSLLLAALAACTPTVAGAQVTQLLFDELLDTEYVADFYDGGFGSLGTGPGPAYGVTFGSNAQVLRAGNYQGNPSPPGAMFWETGTNTFMNVAGGFDGGFSLFYSAVNSTRPDSSHRRIRPWGVSPTRRWTEQLEIPLRRWSAHWPASPPACPTSRPAGAACRPG